MLNKKKAMEMNQRIGWDSFIGYIWKNTKNKYIQKQIDNYYKGYDYCIDDDIDGGKCFEMRERAINNIMKHYKLEYIEI